MCSGRYTEMVKREVLHLNIRKRIGTTQKNRIFYTVFTVTRWRFRSGVKGKRGNDESPVVHSFGPDRRSSHSPVHPSLRSIVVDGSFTAVKPDSSGPVRCLTDMDTPTRVRSGRVLGESTRVWFNTWGVLVFVTPFATNQIRQLNIPLKDVSWSVDLVVDL